MAKEQQTKKSMKASKKKKKSMRVFKAVVITVFILASALFGGGWGYVNYLVSLSNNNDTTEKFDQKNIVKNEGVEDKEEYWTFAIFGVDARDSTLGKGNRSDSIILASLNLKTDEVKLTSIYRDTLVDIPGYGYDKMTHAYAFGGPELAISTLNHNFDLDIKDYVTVNFAVTEDIIDLMGGIEMDIQSNEVKWLNGYVHSLAGEGADTDVKYIDGPGLQTLTGSQAVAYARIRYTGGGDYKRAKRQRMVINAAFEKAQTCSLSTLNEVIQTMFSHINTNLTVTDMLSLVKDIANYKIEDSQGFPYHTKNARVNTYSYQNKGIAVDIPTMLAEDLKTLHYELYGEGTPSTVQAPSDSHLDEDNGVANQSNGYGAGENSTTSEESTTEVTDTTTNPITGKSYTPSEDVQTISEYLTEQANGLGY